MYTVNARWRFTSDIAHCRMTIILKARFRRSMHWQIPTIPTIYTIFKRAKPQYNNNIRLPRRPRPPSALLPPVRLRPSRTHCKTYDDGGFSRSCQPSFLRSRMCPRHKGPPHEEIMWSSVLTKNSFIRYRLS